MSKLRFLSASVALFCLMSLPGVAQEFRATINGTISDPNGAAVPAAKLSLRNTATNEELTAESSRVGLYTIPFVKPGKYELSVEAAGFKKAVKKEIELRVNDNVTLDFNLEIGQVSDTMTVTSDAPLLEESTATRGGVIENLRITELPLNGRNPFGLTNLTTGVIFAGNPQFTRPFDNGDNVNFSINGGQRQTNAYLIDGAPNDVVTNSDGARNRSQLNIGYIPTVDATQEFKIMQNFYDAQYGRTGGGVINVTTKSGTNELHGSVYDFLRRYQLDANNTSSNAAGRPRYALDPLSKENLGGHKLDQFGGVVSGPVLLPKLYNGKDKTFFMYGMEIYKENTPAPILTSVPSLLERNGDFSQSGVTIYNPFSTRDTGNGTYVRDPFPGNVIPANLINPVGRAILNAYPQPNTGAANARLNNFYTGVNLSKDDFKNYIGRVDHSFSQNFRMFARYAYNRRDQFDNGANGYTGIGRDAQDPLIRVNHNAVLDTVYVLSPSMILNLRGALTRYAEAAFRQSVEGFDATTLGFPASFSASRPSAVPPRITVEQYPDFGTRNSRQDLTNVLAFEPNLSMIKGKHSIKFGADIRDIRANVFGGSFVYGGGQFTFSRAFTQANPAGPSDSTSGNAVASLLLGVPTSGTVQYTPALAYRWGYYGFYVQDDIRLSSKLSINVGLRYDIEGTPTERYNRMNRGFAFGTPSPLANNSTIRGTDPTICPACSNLTGGLLFAGVNGQDRAAFNRDLNNWQPRIGAAYQIAKRTVIRGGYGIFYLPQANYGGSYGFSIDTPFASTVGGGALAFTPSTTLSNPFPGGLLQPIGASQGLSTFQGLGFQVNNPNRTVPYVHMYSFGIQHQLPGNWKVDASYVASRSEHLNTGDYQSGNTRNLNVNSVEQLAQARQNPNYFNASVPNPFVGLLPNNPSLNGATISRRQLLLPYPQFGSIAYALEPVGKLWYDSLQLNVEKRYSNGLVFVAAYTWSKNLEAISYLNDQDLTPTKNVTAVDRPHRLVMSGVYQLPFGRGKHFASNISKGWNQLIGGWEYGAISTFQSGTPFELPGGVYLLGDPKLSNQNFGQYFNGCVLQADNVTARQPNAAHTGFEPCTNPAWAIRPNFTLRTTPFRTGAIRNPWRPQWDMSINKRFILTESINAQFRFEMFNAFNTPIRNSPNNDPTSTNFGFVANNQSNFPRQIQLGFKLNF